MGVAVVPGNGDGTFGTPLTITFGPADVAVADFNGDGKLDLAALDSSGSVAILLGNGDGTFQPAVTYAVAAETFSQIMISDFNADGKLDVAISGGRNLYVLFGNGDGTFQPSQAFAVPTDLGAVGDFNQDGIPDIAMNTYACASISDCTVTVDILLQRVPKSDFSPTSVAFGSEIVDFASSPQQVILTNDGTASLSVTSIQSGGNFSQSNTCGTGLPAGGSCTINVTFRPSADGLRQNSLTLDDNAPGSPHVLQLIGTGMDFVVTPNSPTSVTVTPGQAANYYALVTPSYGFSQTVSLSCSGAPAHSTCTVTPSSVTLDGTDSVQVSVAVVTMAASNALEQPAAGSHTRVILAVAMLGGFMGVFVIPGSVIGTNFVIMCSEEFSLSAYFLSQLLCLPVAADQAHRMVAERVAVTQLRSEPTT